MKSFLSACIAAVVIAIGGWMMLSQFQKPVDQAYSSPQSVRI